METSRVLKPGLEAQAVNSATQKATGEEHTIKASLVNLVGTYFKLKRKRVTDTAPKQNAYIICGRP